MNGREPPERLRHVLAGLAKGNGPRLEALAGRGSSPHPGELYSLPCHAWAAPIWMVVEVLEAGEVRIAPGDDRSWANVGDLWVGDHELCLRLNSCVTLSGSLLPVDQRIGVLPGASADVLEHERVMRFVQVPLREEDEDQQEWRALVARAARIMPTYLREGVVELRLSEFEHLGAVGGVQEHPASEHVSDEDVSRPRMAAESSGINSAFLAAMDQLDGAMLVDELDCDCGGMLQLVATKAGLSLLFSSEDPDAVPPQVMAMDHPGAAAAWQSGGTIHQRASRILFLHDWRSGPLSLRVALRKELAVRVVDDVWFS